MITITDQTARLKFGIRISREFCKRTVVNPLFTISLPLVAALLLASGCDTIFNETDDFYNNSGQDLSLVAMFPGTNYTMTIQDGGHVEFYSPFIEVHHSAGIWHYERKPYAGEFGRRFGERHVAFYQRLPGNQLSVRLQIQPNGAIYVIPPNSTGAVTNFPPQPKGFPLVPK